MAQRLNNELFLPNFTLGCEDDLIVDYPISYEFGLIQKQFMHVFRRFSSLVDALISEHNKDDFIVLPKRPNGDENDDETIAADYNINADQPKQLH